MDSSDLDTGDGTALVHKFDAFEEVLTHFHWPYLAGMLLESERCLWIIKISIRMCVPVFRDERVSLYLNGSLL